MSVTDFLKSQDAADLRTQALAPSVPAPTPEQPPSPGFRDYAKAIASEASLIPGEIRNAYVGAMRGSQGATTVDETNAASMEQLRQRQQTTSETQKTLGNGFVSQMIQSIPDAGYSIGMIPASLVGGSAAAELAAAPAAATGPVAPFIIGAAELAGATAASYPMMARADEYRNALQLISQENDKRVAAGQEQLTTDEAKALVDKYQENLTESGRWEGGPEALSSAIDAALLHRLPGGSIVGKAIKTAAGIGLAELPTETITQIGQSQALANTPLAQGRTYNFDKPGDWVAAAKEVLPAVLTMAGVTTAGGVGVVKGAESVRDLARARKQGIDVKTLRDRTQQILKFKADNPEVELSDAEINAFLSGAVKTPAEVAQETGTAKAAAADAASAQVAAEMAAKPVAKNATSEAVSATNTTVSSEGTTAPTMAAEQKGVATAALDRAAAKRQESEDLKKVSQLADKMAAATPETTYTPEEQSLIQAYPKRLGALISQRKANDLSALRQETQPGPETVPSVRPAPQANEGVTNATRQAQVQEGVQQERQGADGNLPPEGQNRQQPPAVDQGRPEAVAGNSLPNQGGQEVVQTPLSPVAEVPSEPAAQTPVETGAAPAAAEPVATTPAPAVSTAMPRLKRGYSRSYFTVADPAYAGNVFVEETSAKGKTTLYVKKRGGQVEKASSFIADRIAGKERVPYEGAQFDEQVSPMAALRQTIEKETGQVLPTDAFVEARAPKGQEELFAQLEQALGKRIVFFRNNSAIAFNGVTGIVPDTLFVNAETSKPHLVVAGHEFLHDLKREDREGYEALAAVVRDIIPEKTRMAKWKGLNEKRAAEGRPAISLSAIDEELVADFFGEQFTSLEFWRRVQNRNPEGFAGLVQRLIDFLDRLSSQVTRMFRGDFQKARDVAAEVLANYVKANPPRAGTLETAQKYSEEPFRRAAQANLKGIWGYLSSGGLTTRSLESILKVAPEQTVVDVYQDRMPRLPDLSATRGRREAVRNEIIDDFGIHGQRLTDEAQKGPGLDALETAAATGTFYRMWPNKPLAEQDWVTNWISDKARERQAALLKEFAEKGTIKKQPLPEGVDPQAYAAQVAEAEVGQIPLENKLKGAQTAWVNAGMEDATGKSFQEAHKAAKQAFEALKTDNLKEDYLVGVEMMERTRDREYEALRRLIEEHTADNPQLRADQLSKLEAAKNSIQGAYWPLYREGRFVLEYLDQDGRRNVEQFESDFARRQNMAALQRLGVDPQTFRLDLRQEGSPYSGQIPLGYNEALGKAIEADYMKGVDPQDSEAVARAQQQAQDVIRQMTEIWLRWQPETSALKNNIRRRNVLGFSMNMLRGFLRYGQSHASRIANLEEGRKVEAILQEIDNDLKAKAASGVDVTRERMVYQDMLAREAMSKKTGTSKIAQILVKMTTFHYMTSPSIALVQMSQLGVLTLPRLAVKTSLAQATKSLSKGVQWAFSPRYSRQAMLDEITVSGVYDDMHAVITQKHRDQVGDQSLVLGEPIFTQAEMDARIAKLTPYQQQLLALRESMAQNLLDISLSHEVADIAGGGDPQSAQGKVFRSMMFFMRESEKASRKAAILAAYDAAQADGKSFSAAMADVKDLVNSTLFNFSKDAKGVLLQNGAVRVLTTFQNFRIMTAFKMALLFKQSFRAAEPEVRHMAQKELVGIFGMSGLLAGTLGMPFAPVLMKLISSVVGSDDEPFDAEAEFEKWLTENFGQTSADVVTQGPASLLGTTLSRRIGLGDVFGGSQDMPPQLHGNGALDWWTTQLLGPSYAMVSGYARGYDEMFNKGEVLKGLISASPKPLKDALKAYSAAADGVKTGTGLRLLKPDEVSANEVLLMGLGFAPLEIGRVKDKAFEASRLGARLSLRRGELVRDFVQAFQDGVDTTDERQAILAYNQKNPEFGIGGSDLRSALRAALKEDLGIKTRRQMLLDRRVQ